MTDHLEARRKSDGKWSVWYPDEGFIPCAPVCHLKHKHEYEAKLVESYYKPTSEQDAKQYAKMLANGRVVKVVKTEKRNAKILEKEEKGSSGSNHV